MSIYAGPDRRVQQLPVPRERRKPGRPRLVDGEGTSTVSVRLPESLHDLTCQLALQQGEDVGAIIRHALRHFVFANQPKR